jgi:hypothetical protein
MPPLPDIAIIHEGNQPYLHAAAEMAVRSGNRVTILDYSATSPQRDTFRAKYRLMANYPQRFDLQCFERYFILQSAMTEHGLNSIFHMDSDVLMFDDVRAFERQHLSPSGISAGIHMPASQPGLRMSYGGHTSYWTRSALDSFCEYLVNVYDAMPTQAGEKWDWHRTTGVPGGVCDMTMLYLWAQGRKLANFAEPIGEAVFDYNINSAENAYPDEYQTYFGKKKIFFRDGRPYGRLRKDGKAIRFRSLHFQGAAKTQMERYSGGRTYALLPLAKEHLKSRLKQLRGR